LPFSAPPSDLHNDTILAEVFQKIKSFLKVFLKYQKDYEKNFKKSAFYL